MGLMVDLSGSGYSKLPNVKKNNIDFFTYERNSQNHHFCSFFHYSGQKFIKNISSDTLFHCEFCLRIRIWGQLDSDNAQRCLKICIFARKWNKTCWNLPKYIILGIFEHCQSPIDLNVRVISFYQKPNSKFQNSLTRNRTTYFFDLFWSNELSQLVRFECDW